MSDEDTYIPFEMQGEYVEPVVITPQNDPELFFALDNWDISQDPTKAVLTEYVSLENNVPFEMQQAQFWSDPVQFNPAIAGSPSTVYFPEEKNTATSFIEQDFQRRLDEQMISGRNQAIAELTPEATEKYFKELGAVEFPAQSSNDFWNSLKSGINKVINTMGGGLIAPTKTTSTTTPAFQYNEPLTTQQIKQQTGQTTIPTYTATSTASTDNTFMYIVIGLIALIIIILMVRR